MNPVQLRNLIQVVNKRERSVNDLEKIAFYSAADWLNEMILQGKDLLTIRATVPHGEWKALFGKQIKVSYDKAVRYMRVAAHASNLPELNSAGSLRQALALIADRAQPGDTDAPQRWPSHIEGITRASKFIGFIERHPLTRWPSESVDRLKEQMLPIVRQLWPDGVIQS